MSTMKEMVKAVRVHATANYNTSGWDYIVESYEDSEIEEELRGGDLVPAATTRSEAIWRIGKLVDLLDDRRKDAQGFIDSDC